MFYFQTQIYLHLLTGSFKVLHGDLAARNVLLADDGVAKVADFGMARKMYYEGNYQQSGEVISFPVVVVPLTVSYLS